MKKTISVNISGINFHIDEDAYARLHKYLESIRSHFMGKDGGEEIMSDIEWRISELLQSKITDSKQVISMDDVEEVIRIMGQPSDFAPEEEQTEEQDNRYVRYQKRLYRDTDRKIIGGVCSGIGAYFNLDPLWVRLIFILLVFAPGFGILLYVILWIVVPEARTIAEKLEMRGQPVTVSALEQSVRQEMGDIREKVNEMADKARESYHRQRQSFREHDKSYVGENLKSIGHFFMRVLGIVTGIIIFFLAASLSLAFLLIILRFPGVSIAEHTDLGLFPLFPFLSMVLENDADLRTFSIGIIILIGIPLLLLMLAGLRMIFRMPSIKYINGAAGWIWLLTFIITLYFGVRIAMSFREEAALDREQVVSIPKGDTLRLVTRDNLPIDQNWRIRRSYSIPEWGIYLTDSDDVVYGIPRIYISLSPDSAIYMHEKYTSMGSSIDDAADRAEAIEYSWSLDNNTLVLPESFTLPAGEKWKKQEVVLDLKLPQNCIFITDDNLDHLAVHARGMSKREMSNRILIMTPEGVRGFVP